MIELTQHIEVLLLENDCVIIPGLGGFVAHYTPAMRVIEEDTFLPPTRVIGFNPQLKMNDGLLVQSYMAVYGTNFSDATKTVDRTVKELLALLHEDGKVDLANVGELRYSIYDTYDFVPYNNKITTPYLYGLDSFEIKELSEIKKPYDRTIPPARPVKEIKKPTFKFRINRSYLSNAAAMIAVIALFFFLSAPIENTEVIETNYAQLLPNDLFEKIEKQSLVITSVNVQQQATNKQALASQGKEVRKKERQITPIAVKEVKVRQLPTTDVAPQPKQEAQPAAISQTARMPYHIVVASVGSEKDAEVMARQLIEKGFENAKAIIGDGKMRVSIQSCSTHAEAYRVLGEIRQNEAYQSAWILKHTIKH